MNKWNYFPTQNRRGAIWLLLSLDNDQREVCIHAQGAIFRLPKAHPSSPPVTTKPKEMNSEERQNAFKQTFCQVIKREPDGQEATEALAEDVLLNVYRSF